MILPVITYGSSILREKALDIDGKKIPTELANNMLETLKNANGIGLAGPQVGILKNIFIIDITGVKDHGQDPAEMIIFNPSIIDYSDDLVYFNEGCLSLPGLNEDVLRPEKIEVKYRDVHFDEHREVLEGLKARIFQHEMDHLQGILFIDRLSAIRKKMIRSKLRKMKQESSAIK